MPDCIRTHSGKYVNVFEPTVEMIDIRDIAHALGQMPRFGGHLPVFYSVAEHSVAVSWDCPAEYALEGLLHDASEAYLMDIPSPIKARLANYKEIENNLMEVIAKALDFQYPLLIEIKQSDRRQLEWEWERLMLTSVPQYKTMNSEVASCVFLERYRNLQAKRTQDCYKTGLLCKYNCSGLCKDNC